MDHMSVIEPSSGILCHICSIKTWKWPKVPIQAKAKKDGVITPPPKKKYNFNQC